MYSVKQQKRFEKTATRWQFRINEMKLNNNSLERFKICGKGAEWLCILRESVKISQL